MRGACVCVRALACVRAWGAGSGRTSIHESECARRLWRTTAVATAPSSRKMNRQGRGGEPSLASLSGDDSGCDDRDDEDYEIKNANIF